MEVRLAEVGDAEAIRTIYNPEVTSSTATFDLVRPHHGRPGGLAALDAPAPTRPWSPSTIDGQVIGFGSLSPYRDRPAYTTTVEDSVYVRRSQQGLGVGRALLEELVRLATAHGFHSVIARIVGGHEGSIALHRACGFEVVGTEREVGRKFGRWLDVVVMQRLLG